MGIAEIECTSQVVYHQKKSFQVLDGFFFRLINFLKKFIFLSNLILNMVKKFNNDEIFIKGLLDSKMKPAEILKKYKEKYKSLKLTYQKLNYWKSIKFNKPIVRKKKIK